MTDMRDTEAGKALSERIALYRLTGWRFLWRSSGVVWDAFMAGVTDGVTYRVIDAMGCVVRDEPCEVCVSTRIPPAKNAQPNSAYVEGPVRPTPTHYPHDEIPGRPPHDEDSDDPAPLPPRSCWYAPWKDVYNLAQRMRETCDDNAPLYSPVQLEAMAPEVRRAYPEGDKA